MINNINILQGDITDFKGDAIVNPANIALKGGGGLCGHIFDIAGENKLSKACSKIGPCEFGDAIVTRGYNLTAKYIIHTATPIYNGHHGAEADILKSCYWESLRLAEECKMTTVAFPLLSAGIHGYPKEEAANIAIEAINEYFEDNPKSKVIVSFYAYTKEDESILYKTMQNIK